MAKLSSTGKPLCSSCNRLATHRLAGYDRIEQKTFYAYQCDEHKHATSEPIPECPFCAFFEQPARLVGTGKIGDVPACDVCSEGPDISEMLLDWLEMQQQPICLKKIDTALIGYDDNDQPFATLVFTDGTTQRIEPTMPEWQEAYKQIATWPDKIMARHFEVQS